MKLGFFSFLRVLLDGKSSRRFLVGVIGSFAFSIAVILSTIGLMDGFESTLVKSLKKSSGDLILKRGSGFFLFDQAILDLKKLKFVEQVTPVVKIEAFAISESKASGVLVKGIVPSEFREVTDLDMDISDGSIAIGKELAIKYDLKIDDELSLTFASKQKNNQGNPVTRSFVIGSIVEHKVYEKDLRFIYISNKQLLKLLNLKQNTTNTALIKVREYQDLDNLDLYKNKLSKKIDHDFKLTTFWDEYHVLLEAVEVEKFSISLILQLIVIVAIFNIIAFIIFISEKKSQELFLLRVLGINLKSVTKFWMLMLVFLWGISSFLSIGLTYTFDFLIRNLSFFKLPGDVYVLSRLGIDLKIDDYILVFGLSLVWILLIGILSIIKLRRKTLLQGLRQEFS